MLLSLLVDILIVFNVIVWLLALVVSPCEELPSPCPERLLSIPSASSSLL